MENPTEEKLSEYKVLGLASHIIRLQKEYMDKHNVSQNDALIFALSQIFVHYDEKHEKAKEIQD